MFEVKIPTLNSPRDGEFRMGLSGFCLDQSAMRGI